MDLPGSGEDQHPTGDQLPRRLREDISEFGSDSRQVDKHAGFSIKVPRPDRPQLRNRASQARSLKPATQDDDDDEEEEILVIEGVTVPCTQTTSFDVFLNLPDADQSTPLTAAEYVGTYYHVPHASPTGKAVTNMRMGIGDTMKHLGISDHDDLVVTLVHRGAGPDDTPITVKGVRIEYE